MSRYIDLILSRLSDKRKRRGLTIEIIYSLVEEMKREEDPNYKLSDSDKEQIQSELRKGIEELKYVMVRNDHYTLMNNSKYRVGIYHGNSFGDGEVVTADNTYRIPRSNGYKIWRPVEGDQVLIELSPKGSQGVIKKILKRDLFFTVGEIARDGDSFFLKAYDKKLQAVTICLPGDDYIEGDVVSVFLEEKTDSANTYNGTINEVIYHKDDPREGVLEQALSLGMPHGFSKESIKQIETIPYSLSEKDYEGRYDFRGSMIFSIDGADTKDKDDCISLEKLENGNYLLGVHIADTPAFVPTDSPIHKDAYTKGTSYYFGGGVEPQYPREISNRICSLLDGVDRLTKSTLIEINPNGFVVSKKLVKGVIHSKIGMTYDKVNDILTRGIVDPEYREFVPTLQEMNNLAILLRNNRQSSGALSFPRSEIKFIYDEKGYPVDVCLREQGAAEKLIEEFMIAGNVAFAEILTENGLPCVYRVHETPNLEHLTYFLKFLGNIGCSFPVGAEMICNNRRLFQQLINHVSNLGSISKAFILELIRCMSHAQYSSKNIGHYGTANYIYTHYTSPVRRLADDTNSRIAECLFIEDPVEREKIIKYWKANVNRYASQATEREMLAEKVERLVNGYDIARYLARHIDEEFEATIVSIEPNFVVVQLDNMIEGYVYNLQNNYSFSPKNYSLTSLSKGENYYLGDRVRVKLVGTNEKLCTSTFSIIEKVKGENNVISGAFTKVKKS